MFSAWIDLGLTETFRLCGQPPKTVGWWDYRKLAFPKNHGLRSDRGWLSPALDKV